MNIIYYLQVVSAVCLSLNLIVLNSRYLPALLTQEVEFLQRSPHE